MPDTPKDSPRTRMWSALFMAAIFAYAAFYSIFHHEILGRWRSSSNASPVIGFIVGGIQVAVVVYFLFTAWRAYQDLKTGRKQEPPEEF